MSFFFLLVPPSPCSTLFPYTTLFRSLLLPLHGSRQPDVQPHLPTGRIRARVRFGGVCLRARVEIGKRPPECKATARCGAPSDRKSTRLNSSHLGISYAVFCLKKKHNT